MEITYQSSKTLKPNFELIAYTRENYVAEVINEGVVYHKERNKPYSPPQNFVDFCKKHKKLAISIAQKRNVERKHTAWLILSSFAYFTITGEERRIDKISGFKQLQF